MIVRNLAVHKAAFLFFMLCLMIFASFALRNIGGRHFLHGNKTEKTSLLKAELKSRKDSIAEVIRDMGFDCESSLESMDNTGTVVMEKAVFDTPSYDDLPNESKSFYPLFLKLMILPSCALICLFMRRWLIFVSNFKIGLSMIRYLHLKDGKKEAVSFH